MSHLRRASESDAGAAADLWLRAREAAVGTIPPPVHDDEDVRAWFASHVVELAKRARPDGLQLWTFASNVGAQRFYERHGFVAIRRTDGRDNEEGAPDILYVWGKPDR